MTRLAADEANWETASGLAVTACAQPHLRRAQIACFVRTGSRFEAPATNGLSHFLEHMIYRGTPGLPTAHAVNYAFEDLGGMLNAATYVDHAVYSVSCPPESLDATSMLFGKLLANPLFSDIETERGIVLEEILEDLDDDGNDVDADNASRRLMYPQHPLGFTITGSAATVGSFGVDDLRRHHTSHYGAGNVVLAYGGAVTLDAARKLGERDFGSMRQAARVQSPAPLAVANSPTFLYVPNQGSQSELRVCYKAPSDGAAERPAVDMLMRLIDDGMSTRLYERLCDRGGLCYQVSAGYDGYEDDGIVDFAAACEHSRAEQVLKALLEVAAEIAAHGPTDAELDKAKRRAKWDTLSYADSAEELVSFHATTRLFARAESPEGRLERCLAVTREELRSLAAKVFASSERYVAVVGDLKPAAVQALQRIHQST
jgi:predicted Zn-dependent peptidase